MIYQESILEICETVVSNDQEIDPAANDQW